MVMKNLTKVILVLFLVLFILDSCKKDDPINPDPNPDPYEEGDILQVDNDIQVIRITLDSIKVIKGGDKGNGFELLGIATTKVNYLGGYINTDDLLEKKSDYVLWYYGDNSKEYLRLKPGELVKIDNYVDYYLNANHIGKTEIVLDIKLFDRDENSIQEFTVGMSEVEEINGQSAQGGKEIWVQFQNDPEHEVWFYYHFENFNQQYQAKYLPGYENKQEFVVTNNPDFPAVTAYKSSVPQFSDRWVVAQKKRSKFYPQISLVKIKGGGPLPVYNYKHLDQKPELVLDGEVNPNPEIESQNFVDVLATHARKDLYKPYAGLLKGLEMNTGEKANLEFPPGIVPDIEPLETAPFIQMIKYWKAIKNYSIPAGVTITEEVTITNGWEESISNTFSILLGFKVSGGAFGFESEFKTEITNTFNTSSTMSLEKEYTTSTSFTAPNDKNVVMVLYELIEEYRLVDEDGKIYIDPNYEFASMDAIAVGTETTKWVPYHFEVN
jgi:hypothetical protein